MSELVNRGLPKWPQMFTTGRQVTPDQAKEIIRRTDMFMTDGYGGNDHAWDRAMATRLRMTHHCCLWSVNNGARDWSAMHDREDRWLKAWGAIGTEYVHNNWMSCAYVYGPHGWCWPDGRIAYVDNVGKWPSVEDVLRDWTAIAEAFPFLHLAATLMSGEHCEDTEPVVTIVVDGGRAHLDAGWTLTKHRDRFGPTPAPRNADSFAALFTPGREHGPIPGEWYAEWEALAAKLFGDQP